MTAHEDWIQSAIGVVRAIEGTFTKPDDDWSPVLLGKDATGRRIMADIGPAFFDEHAKERFATELPLFIVAAKLHCVAMVASSWIVELAPGEQAQSEQGEWVRPAEHPRRKEIVMVYACSHGAESMSFAEIRRRRRQPPRLSEWQQATTQDVRATSVAGRFAEPIRAAVSAVRGETPTPPADFPGARFPLGRVVATPGAVEVMDRQGIRAADLLRRHVTGDWGDLGDEDKRENDHAIGRGLRILSAYGKRDAPDRLWVITEADRSATTILRPDEY